MKKLLALVLTLALTLSLASVSLADSIVAATNCAFPPYEYYENGVEAGIDVDIVKAICEKLGYDLTIVDLSNRIQSTVIEMCKELEKEEN